MGAAMCLLRPRSVGKPKKKKKIRLQIHRQNNQIRVLTLEDLILASPQLNKGTKASTDKRDVSRIVAVFPSPEEEHEEVVSADSGKSFHVERETDPDVKKFGGDDLMVGKMIRELAPKRVRFQLPTLSDIIVIDSTRR